MRTGAGPLGGKPAMSGSVEASRISPPSERIHVSAPYSYATIGAYTIIAVLLLATGRASVVSSFPYVTDILAALFFIFLARYLSTRYWLGAETFTAWRLFGSRRFRLEQVRRIEFANLRDLSPVGFIGSWGWRGRMWSPVVGHFDSVYTVSDGVLISAGKVPLFISPKDPAGFARELSRRVRSVTGPLAVDVGAPPTEAPAGS